MKDHELREQVNELKELVLKFKDTQQLRSRLAIFLSDFKTEVEKDCRQSVEVEMPEIRHFYGASSECEEGYEVHEIVDLLEALGFKLKFGKI